MVGVHLRDVSQAAGVNLASVSYHFGSLPNLLNAAVRDAVEVAIGEQAERLASLPAEARLADLVSAWIRPTVRGLQEAPEELILLGIASRALSDTPPDLREWAQDVLARTQGLLIDRLRPVLTDLDEKELAFRVFCIGGIVNRLNTAAHLPQSAAVASPEFERLLVAAITGLLAGQPGTEPVG